MTSRPAPFDVTAPCGTPARLRWHLAHGQRCEVCEAMPQLPLPVLCHECGSKDRPGVLAHFVWLESELTRLRAALELERIRNARVTGELELERVKTKRLTAKVSAADQGLNALLTPSVIQHEAVNRVLRAVEKAR